MAFDLTGRLTLIDQMSAPLKKATRAMSGLGGATAAPRSALGGFVAQGKKASAWGGSFKAGMGGVISTLGRVGAVIGATKIALNTAKSAMDFDQQMANIASISPEAKAARGDLHDLAIQMGMKTKYSALEAASSIENLVRAGRSVDQILGGDLEASMNLAAADGMDLADAAMIMADTMNTFSRDGLAASDVADILAGASSAASTDVTGLRQGLSAVGSVASSVGLSLADTTTALGLMANAGIKGSDAGTSLKTMLMRLQPTSKSASKMMKELGIITKDGANKFYDSSGQLKSMAEISGILQDSMQGLTDQQRAVAMETMFGADAVRAANVLYAEGAEGVENFQDAMSRTSALQMAAEKLDSASGAADILKGVLSTLQIVVGEALLPIIKDFCTWAAKAATKIVEWLQSAEGQEVLAKLTDAIETVIGSIVSICSWLGEQLSPLFETIKTDVTNLVSAFADWFSSDDGQAWLAGVKGYIEATITALENIYNFVRDVFQAFAPAIEEACDAVMGAFGGVIDAITGFINGDISLAEAGSLIMQSLCDGISGMYDAAVTAIQTVWNAIPGFLAECGLSTEATAILQSLIDGFMGMVESIYTTLSEIWGTISDFWSGEISLSEAGYEIMCTLGEGFKGVIEGLGKILGTIWDGVTGYFSDKSLLEVGTTVLNTIGDGFSAAWEFVGNLLDGFATGISGCFDGISLKTIGGNIIDGLWDGLKSAWKDVTDWLKGLTDYIPSWMKDALGIHSPSRVMRVLGEYTMQGFALGLDDEQKTVEANAVEIANTPARAVSATTQSLESEAPSFAVVPTGDNNDNRPTIQFSGDIVLQNVTGDLRDAADEFMEIIAEKLQGEGDLVA